jgi:hypothetical protein
LPQQSKTITIFLICFFLSLFSIWFLHFPSLERVHKIVS